MTETREEGWPNWVRRTLNLLAGFGVGLLLFPALVAAGILIVMAWPKSEAGPTEPFVLAVSGADVSRAGGQVIEVVRTTDQLRQDCREGCDDVRLEDRRGGVESIRVLKAGGACVACRDVAGPYEASRDGRWTIAGDERLSISGGASR
jgi:hypothetical protein